MRANELADSREDHVWHFVGNAGLFGFEGTISAYRYQLSPSEDCMVRPLEGLYREVTIDFSSGHR